MSVDSGRGVAPSRARYVVSGLALALGLVIFCAAAGVVVFQRLFSSPPEVTATQPPPACGLIPADLRDRLVPGGEAKERSSAGLDWHKTTICDVTPDFTKASGDAIAWLTVSVHRYGTFLRRSPQQEARRSFIQDKKYVRREKSTNVYDLSGLGRSAFLAVDRPSDGGANITVRVQVLLPAAGAVEVRYQVRPSSPELAASAAVAVSRQVMEQMR